ncbi:MAG: GIY-YIG nuclease family protein, partial [Chloroflexota bacterium]
CHVQEHGPSTPAELSRAVFGGSGFGGLLPQIAGSRLRFDGERWHLPQPGPEIAFLQLLTSGPQPERHRLVEVAAARGATRFHAFVSGPPPPASLRVLGLPAEPEDALPPDKVQAVLRELLAGSTVVGFALPAAFLDRLLGPAWPALDVLAALLALTNFPGRPDPLRVAKHLGLAAPKNVRPEELLHLAQGVHAVLLAQHGHEALRREGLPRRTNATMPAQADDGPGVYVMASAAGDPLYVGKSVSLRRRVRSYLGSPIAETRSLYHLLPMTTAIEVIPVQDDVQALLLEAALIGRWQPRFNTQRQRRAGPCYLRLTSTEPFPRLTLALQPVADGSCWFGPFQYPTAARRMRDLVT